MTPLLEITLYFTLLTFVTVVLGAAIRNQEWTKEGRDIGLGNRDNLKAETPMGGRADRAAKNSIEALVFFAPLAVLAHLAGWTPRCCWARRSPFGREWPTCLSTSQGSSTFGVWSGLWVWWVTG